jgi:hypothetical protein
MNCRVEMASVCMIYIPNFMKIGTGFQAILRLYFRNLRGSILVLLMGGYCDVHGWGIFTWHDNLIKFHEEWYRCSSNIKVSPEKYEGL